MSFYINVSEFKHPITIERFTKGVDEDNIPINVWSKLFDSRAKILNVRGEEFYSAMSVNSKIDKTFYIRVHRDYEVTSKDRVVYNNKAYNILYVNNIDESGKYLEIKVERVE